jgi:hypothetical protein
MTGPYAAVQAAVVAALEAAQGLQELTGIYDGPPARAAFPYVSMGNSLTSDWGTKTEAGREIRLALTLWDDGAEPARLHRMIPDIEAAILALPAQLDGWRIISRALVRVYLARDPQGPWAGLVEHRIRLFQN